MVSTRQGFHQGKTIIISTGVNRKQLSIPGEMEYKGRGVSYCAVCDGPFFQGKRIVVVGEGQEAVHDAEVLAESAEKVYAIPGSKGYSDDFPELDRIKNNPKVEVLEGVNVTEVGGGDFVEYVKISGGEVDELKVDGLFIILEHVSTTGIVTEAGIEVDAGGCILVDNDMQTTLPGIYAAGDCSCKGMQIVTASGMGAKAALSALKYVRNMG
jgi:thioredoxin reductase (NADPH)